MSEFAVIAQNDESKWHDIKGDLYHFPSMYRSILTPGCRIIYYKGKMKNRAFSKFRLSPEPHYFGLGIVGESIADPDSRKGDRYCEILGYQEFEDAVPIKREGEYLEEIPESKRSNYWRSGVRSVSQDTYERILSNTKLTGYKAVLPSTSEDFESFQPAEGKKKRRYSSYYERNPFYRNKAIEIHGLCCMVCMFNFEEQFGELGRGYIHVHHNKPLSESGPTTIDPRKDMSVLCPNCHAMIHRLKNETLSVETLCKIYSSSP